MKFKDEIKRGPREFVDEFLREAVAGGATDVHFEPGSDQMAIRYRIDGVLEEIEKVPRVVGDKLIGRLQVMGNLLSYRNDIPQEGRIACVKEHSGWSGAVTDKRVSTFPTIYGPRAVVRIFYENRGLMELDELGLPGEVVLYMKKFSVLPQGVLIMTGPAGAGKSTTLSAMLRYIIKHNPGKSVISLEDPVERQIEGVTQVQISGYGEMDFPKALRSLLRQDPEVIMVGEIRDAETARIVIEAGLTGHLLMTTMHSVSGAGALLRLLEMGVEAYQITSAVTGVVNQRLLRKVCKHCFRRAEDGRSEAAGCEKCFNSGYRDRTVSAELVRMEGAVRKVLLGKGDLEEIKGVLKEGGHKGLFEHGMELVKKGITTEDEVKRHIGSLDMFYT